MPELVTSAAPPRNPVYWISIIAYWIFTLLVAFEMVAGGIWDLLRIEYVRVILQHLGYPIYLLFIIGVWKIPCAVTVLVPRFLRLKEWAYAGALFNYTGAAASHLAVGDGANRWSPPLALAAFTLASWALRPRSAALREQVLLLAHARSSGSSRSSSSEVMLVLSLLSLPKGPPP
jgi:hypothetical protein